MYCTTKRSWNYYKRSDCNVTEDTGKTIYEFALNSLVADCIKEYMIRNEMYKDAWLDMDVETLKHIVKGEAGKLVATEDSEMLVHRIIDLVNYSIFLYAQVKKGT